jgi:hypothetical protein
MDALLKKTGITLELLTYYHHHLFVMKGLRRGISMVSMRYARANNPQVGATTRRNPPTVSCT